MDLWDTTASYLKAEGYEVAERPDRLLTGSRRAPGGRDHVYVWVPSYVGQFPERMLMAAFGKAASEQPQARKVVLLESLQGVRSEFRRDARHYFGVSLLTPPQLFDTAFRHENSPTKTRTATRDLVERGRGLTKQRVEQPYSFPGGDRVDEDLLPTLYDALRSRDSNSTVVHVVVGPAGAGKSVLFESLFAQLHDRFLEDKAAQVSSRRPLPLIPGHGDYAADQRLNALMSAFLSSEFARPLSEDAFAWKLTHGYGAWMIDGLDEVISRDNGLFDWIYRLIDVPDAPCQPTILICVRDSLFATNRELRTFVDDLGDLAAVYTLARWGDDQKRTFAESALGGEASSYLEVLKGRPRLDEMATLPYYSQLLLELYEEELLSEDLTERDLLEAAIDGIIKRERDKPGVDLLDPRYVDDSELRELLEAMAGENLKNAFQGIRPEFLREWADLVAAEDMDQEDRETLVIQLTQLPVFTDSSTGQVRFAQEVLEHYLLAEHLLGTLNRDRQAFAQWLSYTFIPWSHLTASMLSRRLREAGREGELIALAYENQHRPNAFKNLLQLIVLGDGTPDALKEVQLSLERTDLAGVRFEGTDLSRLSLRGADLTEATFEKCDLSGSTLDGAILRNTRFTACNLTRADIGGLTGFASVTVDGHEIRDRDEAARRLSGAETSTSEVQVCDAGDQLYRVVTKFVYPTGRYRRDWLPERAMFAGAQYLDDPQKLVDALVRDGYLTYDRAMHRYERPDGDAYTQLVAFAKDLQLSPGLQIVLGDACPAAPDCRHVTKRGSVG